MKLHANNLLFELLDFDTIIVTGPQRSGTTIAASIISAETDYKLVLEEEFNVYDVQEFFNIIKNKEIVVQAPSMSAFVGLITNRVTAVIFMIRPEKDIIESQERIEWPLIAKKIEFEKYCTNYQKNITISQFKLNYWRKYQSGNLRHRAFELKYNDLSKHPLFIPKKQRLNFHPRQISL